MPRPREWAAPAHISNKYYGSLTLGEAIEFRKGPSIACACAGCPLHEKYCWCALGVGQEEALHRAAHIIAKMMKEVADRAS